MAYRTKQVTSGTYKVDSYSLVIQQSHSAEDRTVTMAVRRVKLSSGEDQLQIDVETFTRGKKRGRTDYTALVLPPEFAEQFITACQTYWEPSAPKPAAA